jgi:hypothetical protein
MKKSMKKIIKILAMRRKRIVNTNVVVLLKCLNLISTFINLNIKKLNLIRTFLIVKIKKVFCIITFKVNQVCIIVSKYIFSIFTGINIKKVLFIFIVGFITRVIVNYCYDINVFRDFTNIISIIYYIFNALFIAFVDDIIQYLNFVFICFT